MNNRLGRLTLLALAAVMFLFAPGHAQQDSALVQARPNRAPSSIAKVFGQFPINNIVVLDQDATGVAGDVRAVRTSGHCGDADDRALTDPRAHRRPETGH